MKCPSCNSSNSKVIETRTTKDQGGTRRRRECEVCAYRFSTIETLILKLPDVIKKNGHSEAFSQTKILKGLKASCQKRPVTTEQLHEIVDRTIQWLFSRKIDKVSSEEIGIFVLNELKSIDKVASIRFASVHQSFNDVNEFVSHLEKTF